MTPKRIALWMLEGVAVVALIAVAGTATLAWRLSEGPISLDPLEQQIEASLTKRRAAGVDLIAPELAFAPDLRRIVVRARSVVLAPRTAGANPQDLGSIEIGLDMLKLLVGKAQADAARWRGGALWVRLRADQSAAIGFGSLDSPPELIIPAPPPGLSVRERLERVLDQAAAALSGSLRGLDLLALEDIGLSVLHEDSGMAWQAKVARSALTGSDTGINLTLALAPLAAQPSQPAPAQARPTALPNTLTLNLRADRGLRKGQMQIEASELTLRPFLPVWPAGQNPSWAKGAGLVPDLIDGRTNISLQSEISRAKGIETLDQTGLLVPAQPSLIKRASTKVTYRDGIWTLAIPEARLGPDDAPVILRIATSAKPINAPAQLPNPSKASAPVDAKAPPANALVAAGWDLKLDQLELQRGADRVGLAGAFTRGGDGRWNGALTTCSGLWAQAKITCSGQLRQAGATGGHLIAIDKIAVNGPQGEVLASAAAQFGAHWQWNGAQLSLSRANWFIGKLKHTARLGPSEITLAPKPANTRPMPEQKAGAKTGTGTGAAQLQVLLPSIDAVLDGVRARGQGELTIVPGAQNLAEMFGFDGRLSGTGPVPIQSVLDYWEQTPEATGRAWVQRSIREGQARDIEAELHLKPGDLRPGLRLRGLPDEAMTIAYTATSDHLIIDPNLPPLRAARAKAVLRGNSLQMDVLEARMGDVAIGGGRVDIPVFVPREQTGTFSASGTGQARALVDILRKLPRLNLDETLPVDPRSVSGSGQWSVEIKQPMMENPRPEQIAVRFTASFANAGARLSNGRQLSAAEVEVEGNERAVDLKVKGKLDNAPLQLRWREQLRDRGPAPSSFWIQTNVDASALDELGMASRSFAKGRVGMTMEGTGSGETISSANIALDLTDVTLAMPGDLMRKARGSAAQAKLKYARLADGSMQMSDIMVSGADISGTGALLLAPDGRLRSASVRNARLGTGSEIREARLEPGPNGVRITASGPVFNASQMLADILAGRPGTKTGAPLALEGQFETVLVAPGEKLQGVSLTVLGDDQGVRQMAVRGKTPAGARFEHTLTPTADPAVSDVLLESADAGWLVRVIGGGKQVEGGRARLEGKVTRLADGKVSTATSLTLRNFKLTQTPIMARLLSSVGSLRGLGDTLAGEGLYFDGFTVGATLANGAIAITRDARAWGPSLGLTVRGRINLDAKEMNLEGTIAPAYALNSALGALPVLGGLLTSREGEGLVGIVYQVEGPFTQTRVTVNPLSALTPGILRRIFEPVPEEASPAPAPASQAQPGPPSPRAPVTN